MKFLVKQTDILISHMNYQIFQSKTVGGFLENLFFPKSVLKDYVSLDKFRHLLLIRRNDKELKHLIEQALMTNQKWEIIYEAIRKISLLPEALQKKLSQDLILKHFAFEIDNLNKLKVRPSPLVPDRRIEQAATLIYISNLFSKETQKHLLAFAKTSKQPAIKKAVQEALQGNLPEFIVDEKEWIGPQKPYRATRRKKKAA